MSIKSDDVLEPVEKDARERGRVANARICIKSNCREKRGKVTAIDKRGCDFLPKEE